MAKEIWHPHHRTAWSARTTGFPLVGVNERGRVVWKGYTTKRACQLVVPDDVVYILWLYRTNSGRRDVSVLEAKDGLPRVEDVALHDGLVPEDVAGELAKLGLPADSEAAAEVLDWLFPRYEEEVTHAALR